MDFPCRQNEELEPLSEVVGQLGDHKPRPVGDEASTGQVTGSQAVFELLDVVLSTSSTQMMLDETSACRPAVGQNRVVTELADHALVAFVMTDSLDDHAECSRPVLGVIGELTPVSVFLPGIGLPLIGGDCLNGSTEGGCELSGDAKLHALVQKIGDYLIVIEAGVHAHADVGVSWQARQTAADRAYRLVIAVSVAWSQLCSDKQSTLGPEAQQWMEAPDLLVTVMGPLFKEAVDLEDGAVQVQGNDSCPAYELGTFKDGVADDTFKLLYMADGELAEELTRGCGSGDLQIIEVSSCGLLPSEGFKVGQVRSAYEEAVHETHDEIRCGDPTSSLLDAYSIEATEDPEPVGHISYELEARERDHLVPGGDVVDLERSAGYLQLISAPFLAEGFDSHLLLYQEGSTFSLQI
jgi:hypothetical protein